jgi:5-methylcytosine-specific restriction endonuclease McrA
MCVSSAKPRPPVLRREGRRCQSCDAMSNLEMQHEKFRSLSGPDSEENLITLSRMPRQSSLPLRSGCPSLFVFCLL